MSVNPDNFTSFTTTLTAVAMTPSWTAVIIPAGAIDPSISLQDATATFRVSSSATGGATDGVYLPATGAYVFPGGCTKPVTVYICPSAATNAVLAYQV